MLGFIRTGVSTVVRGRTDRPSVPWFDYVSRGRSSGWRGAWHEEYKSGQIFTNERRGFHFVVGIRPSDMKVIRSKPYFLVKEIRSGVITINLRCSQVNRCSPFTVHRIQRKVYVKEPDILPVLLLYME